MNTEVFSSGYGGILDVGCLCSMGELKTIIENGFLDSTEKKLWDWVIIWGGFIRIMLRRGRLVVCFDHEAGDAYRKTCPIPSQSTGS